METTIADLNHQLEKIAAVKESCDADYLQVKKELVEKYGEFAIDETEVLSHAMYPQVYTEFQAEKKVFGDLGILPTNLYLNPMKVGQEEELYSEAG